MSWTLALYILHRVMGGVALGLFCSSVSAYIIWNHLYSIGSAVISDDVYDTMDGTVYECAAIFGCTSALLLALLPLKHLFIAIAGQHGIAAIVGLVLAWQGWRIALLGFFGMEVLIFGVLLGVGIRSAFSPDPQLNYRPSGGG